MLYAYVCWSQDMTHTHYAEQQAYRLTAAVGVLSLPTVALAILPLPPADFALPELLAPPEEADLSAKVLPAVRPAIDRPTDTTWSGDVL